MNTEQSKFIKSLIYSFNAITGAGTFTLILSLFFEKKISYNAYLTGFILYCISFFLIEFLLFMNYYDLNTKLNLKIFMSNLLVLLPPLLVCGLIIYYITLLTKFKSNIISGHISNSFSQFNNTLKLLFFIITIIYYNYFTKSLETKDLLMPKLTTSILYLLFVLCFINLTILTIILKYYTTDGFRLLNS